MTSADSDKGVQLLNSLADEVQKDLKELNTLSAETGKVNGSSCFFPSRISMKCTANSI